MSELDHLKEQVAYLKVWLGIVVVTDISLAGWLISSSDRAASLTVIAMEIIAAIAMFAVVLVIVGVALDAARRAK